MILAPEFSSKPTDQVTAGTMVISGHRDDKSLGIKLQPPPTAGEGAAPLILKLEASRIAVEQHASSDLIAAFSTPFGFRLLPAPQEFTNSYEGDAPTGAIVSTEDSVGIVAGGPWHGRLFVNLDDFSITQFSETRFWVCSRWQLIAHPGEVYESIALNFTGQP